METEHLKEFVMLAEVGNYLDAAERLFISQSSLSKHIQSLEKELGVALFERTTRKISLSPAGSAFLPFAKAMIADMKAGADAVNLAVEASQKILSVGVIPSLDSYGISDILSEYGLNNKGYKLKPIEEDTGALLPMLKAKEIDLAFVYASTMDDISLGYLPLVEDHLVAVCSRKNKSLPLEKMNIRDLKDKNLLLLEGHSVLVKLTMDACKAAGFTPKTIPTKRRFLSSYDLDDENNVAIFFNRDATYVNNPGNRVVELLPTTSSTMCLVYRKKEPLSDEERYLIDIAKQHQIPIGNK
jgi:LysR family transcriptional regulator, transcription activator of glutamate synthase operon